MKTIKIIMSVLMGTAAMISTAGHGLEPPVMVVLALACGYSGWTLTDWAGKPQKP